MYKKILQVISEQEGNQITRKELREKIGEKYRSDGIGYQNQTICNALKSLCYQGKIRMKEYRYQNEIIMLVKSDECK